MYFVAKLLQNVIKLLILPAPYPFLIHVVKIVVYFKFSTSSAFIGRKCLIYLLFYLVVYYPDVSNPLIQVLPSTEKRSNFIHYSISKQQVK